MSDFSESLSGALMRRLAMTTAVVGAMAIGVSLTLDRMLKGGLPQVAIIHADGSLSVFGGAGAAAGGGAPTQARNGVDMTSVGSINSLKIDPCTGQLKR